MATSGGQDTKIAADLKEMEAARRAALRTIARARLAGWVIIGIVCTGAILVGFLFDWLVALIGVLAVLGPAALACHRLMFRLPKRREQEVIDAFANRILARILGRYGLAVAGACEDPEALIRDSGIMPPHTDLEYPEWLNLSGDALTLTIGALYMTKARGAGLPPRRVFEGLMLVARFPHGIDGIVHVWDGADAPGMARSTGNQTAKRPSQPDPHAIDVIALREVEDVAASEGRTRETPFDRLFEVRADPETLGERCLLPDLRERLVEMRTALGPGAAGFRMAIRNDTMDMLLPIPGGPFGRLNLQTPLADPARVARIVPVLRSLVGLLGATEMALLTAIG